MFALWNFLGKDSPSWALGLVATVSFALLSTTCCTISHPKPSPTFSLLLGPAVEVLALPGEPSPSGMWGCESRAPLSTQLAGLCRVVFFSFSILVFFLFYWSIIALQCCVSFCCTMYTYIPSLLDLPPTPPSHPSRSSQSWAPCAIQQVPTSYLFYTR